MALLANKAVAPACSRAPAMRVAQPARGQAVRCRSFVPMELLAAAGDVDAPVTVPIVAALVVTAVVTFAVPAYLNRGQQAADKIFASKQKAPLDKARTAKGKTTKGKTASSKRR